MLGVGLGGDPGVDTALPRAVLQAAAHAAADQHVDLVQGVRAIAMIRVEGLLDGQFQQGFAFHHGASDFIDPELAALAGVAGDGLAVLAGDGNLYVTVSVQSVWR